MHNNSVETLAEGSIASLIMSYLSAAFDVNATEVFIIVFDINGITLEKVVAQTQD